MSTNSTTESSGQGGSTAAPRLISGTEYAVWRPLFANHCKRLGVEVSLHKEIPNWDALYAAVLQWDQDADDALMAQAMSSLSNSGSDSSVKTKTVTVTVATPLSSEETTMRTGIKQMITRSDKVFGMLFASLPEDLRAQTAHISSGYAFGLWRWLQTKFQSTEADSVGDLLSGMDHPHSEC